MTTDSALRHGVAAFLQGEILDVRHWGAMVAPFNASRGAIREACAAAEQMNCIRELVVNSTGTKAIFCCDSQAAAAFRISRDGLVTRFCNSTENPICRPEEGSVHSYGDRQTG